ncbi:MAG: sulfatase-like hydrolase/transferase [Armatimonadota bacterium]|nr:MAG: sulfatase-like hydrolase/transferase [Armatimonadota bacterium]
MNVAVIITDSLRADHTGYMNLGGRAHTPNLDAFAADATVFEHYYPEGLPTLPVRTAWWTGLWTFPVKGWQPFQLNDVLLAEVLWDKGYTSALVADTYHMHKPIYGAGRGFDSVHWIRGQEYDPWIAGADVDLDASPHHRLRGDDSDKHWRPLFEQYLRNATTFKREEDYYVARTVQAAIEWLERITQQQKDGLFLWVDCFDPHEAWDPPEPYWSMYKRKGYDGAELVDPVPGPVDGYMTPDEVERTRTLYAGEVTLVDKWVGVLLAKMRDLGLFDNTLIIHISDHGEPFGEHGIIRKAVPWNYEELVRSPLAIRHPQGVGAGKRVSAFAQSVDIMPTVLDFLGLPLTVEQVYRAPAKDLFPQDMPAARKTVELEGRSLLPLMSGGKERIRDFAYIGHFGRSWTIRTKEWSFHMLLGDGERQLFDLRDDPGEQRNVLRENEAVARELELELRRHVDAVARGRGAT